MIKLFGQRNPDTKHEPKPAVVTSSWARGEALKAAALRAVVWALVVCGPLALGVALKGANLATSAAADPELTEPVGRQLAIGFAEDAVVRWLRAHRGAEDSVAGIFPTGDLPKQPLNVSEPAVTAASWMDGSWVVTVAVTIITEIEGQGSTSQRRYFQLPIRVDDNGDSVVLALPAEIAGPSAVAVDHGYSQQVALTDPIAQTTRDFLNALLAGNGDVTRYTAPETSIEAITPAPYSAVNIETAYTQAQLPESVEGAQAEILVRARAESATSSLRLEYVLQLVLRSSRWEVAAIVGAPAASPVDASGSSDPSSSPTHP